MHSSSRTRNKPPQLHTWGRSVEPKLTANQLRRWELWTSCSFSVSKQICSVRLRLLLLLHQPTCVLLHTGPQRPLECQEVTPWTRVVRLSMNTFHFIHFNEQSAGVSLSRYHLTRKVGTAAEQMMQHDLTRCLLLQLVKKRVFLVFIRKLMKFMVKWKKRGSSAKGKSRAKSNYWVMWHLNSLLGDMQLSQ